MADTTEDFLFHLYRGSELLQDNRMHDARAELEEALRLQPRDAKGQDLLAIVYFRLGLYPRAIEIYEELARAFPRESALSQNLALCYLKTGQAEKARALLEPLVMAQPDHARAWGYLGLAYERLADYEKARAAYQKAGQTGKAARMTQLLQPTTPPQSVSQDELDSRASALPDFEPSPTLSQRALRAIEEAESARDSTGVEGAREVEHAPAAAHRTRTESTQLADDDDDVVDEDDDDAVDANDVVDDDDAVDANDVIDDDDDDDDAVDANDVVDDDDTVDVDDTTGRAEDGDPSDSGGAQCGDGEDDRADRAGGEGAVNRSAGDDDEDNDEDNDEDVANDRRSAPVTLQSCPPPHIDLYSESHRSAENPAETPATRTHEPLPWTMVAEATRLRGSVAHRPSAGEVPSLTELIRTRALAFSRTPGVSLHASGLVLVQVESSFAVRGSAIRAISADGDGFRTKPLAKRVRGRVTEDALGGEDDPVLTLSGWGDLVLAARCDCRLTPLRLDDESVYLHEPSLIGFESGVSYENGRVAGNGGRSLAMVQLRGRGAVLFEAREGFTCLEVTSDRVALVEERAIIGWAGRLLARELGPEEALGSTTRHYAFCGDGTVMLSTAL